MAKRYTTGEAAALIGCHRTTLPRLAKRHRIGEKVGSLLIFTDADVKRLRKLLQAGPGNPKMMAGGESAAELGRMGAAAAGRGRPKSKVSNKPDAP